MRAHPRTERQDESGRAAACKQLDERERTIVAQIENVVP